MLQFSKLSDHCCICPCFGTMHESHSSSGEANTPFRVKPMLPLMGGGRPIPFHVGAKLPIMGDLQPLARLPMAICPLAHLPALPMATCLRSYCLLKIPGTSYWACFASVKKIYADCDLAFFTHILWDHSSYLAWRRMGREGGLISSFWSIPALQSVFLHT